MISYYTEGVEMPPLEVNRQYLQHDYYTDIITFDYCQGNRIAGDLFISLDTIRTNAEQFQAPYESDFRKRNSTLVLYQAQTTNKDKVLPSIALMELSVPGLFFPLLPFKYFLPKRL